MPTVATKTNPGAKFETDVDREIAKIVRRIHTHDIFSGVFLLVVFVMGYLAIAMVLDRLFELPGWVRQISFLVMIALVGTLGYFAILLPLRRQVNPLYAAKEVEKTAPEAKNSVVNWIDLQDKPINESVRAAVAARAAKLLKVADLEKAGESKRLLYLGWSLGLMLVTFAVLFMTFKPAVFTSLLNRAINPFMAGAIATRTQLTLVEPEGGDAIVTAGQPVAITVDVNGKVPENDAPDRIRVLLKHNIADTNYEEVALEPAEATRRWTVRLTDRYVQNGFWYKVAAGDAETAEYRVTVKPKPTFTDFEVRYEYPEYLRMKPDIATTPHIEAHRGTIVTIQAKANRSLKQGRAVIQNMSETIPGEIVGESKDTLRVRMTLSESGSYRLLFQSTDGEANTDAPPYELRVLSDQPPVVSLANPKDEEIALPVNGLLSVDGSIGDDFGIDKVSLRMRLLVPNQAPKPLQDKPYQNGQSFKRETDGTYPTTLEYKDSIALDKILDEAGRPLMLTPDSVIEYWIEATDNCTVPIANTGKSKIQRVRLVAAKVDPKQKDELNQQIEKRKQDEAEHKQNLQQKLQQEQRPANSSPKKPNEQPQGANPESQPGEKSDPSGQKQEGAKAQADDAPMTKSDPLPEKNNKDPRQPGDEGKPAANSGETTTETKPSAADAQEKKELRQKADEIQKQIEEEQNQSGDAKGSAQKDSTEKDSAPKGSTQKSSPMDPRDASGSKKAKPMDQGATAEPKPSSDEKPTDTEEKSEPLGGSAGTEKPTPQDANRRAEQQLREKAVQDLAGNDETKKQAAREELDRQIGEDNRKELERKLDERKKIAEGLQSNDPKERARAEDNASQLQRELMEQEQERNAKTRERQEGDAEQLSRKKELEQAVRDLNSDDPKKRDQGKEKLDELVGKEARQQAEKLRDQLKSGDKDREQAAKDELNRMKKSLEQQAAQEQAANKAKLEKAAKDLASDDPQKKQDAKKEIDRQLGQGAGDQAEREMNKKKQTGEMDGEKAAKQALEQAREDANEKAAMEKAANEAKLEKAAKDLASDDPQKKQDAKKEIDRQLGQGAGDQAEQQLEKRQRSAQKQQSPNPKDQQEGNEESEKLQRELTEEAFKNSKSRKSQSGDADQLTRRKEIEEAAKDLNSDDPMKREAAEKKLDELVGKDARQKAQQLGEDLKSGDKNREQAAVEELQKAQKAAKKQSSNDEKQTSPEEKAAKQDQLEKAAKDLAGNDEARKKEAREKLDREIGKDRREELEKHLNDRKEAAEKLQAKNEADKQAGESKKEAIKKDQLSKAAAEKDRKEIEDAARDLLSDDKDKQQAARKKLEEKFGKEAVDKAEQLGKDLKSGDKNRQQAAMDELKKMQQAAERQAKNDPAGKDPAGKDPSGDNKKPLSPDEIEKLAQAAKDLQSPDEQKRKDAEKQLDDKLGQDARKQLQDMMKDGQEPTKEQMEAAKKALEQLSKNMPRGPGNNQRDPRRDGGIGGTPPEAGKPLDANQEFDKRAGQLQLEQLKKAEANKELLKKLGYTEEEYRRFLEGYEKLVREAPEPKDIPLNNPMKPSDPQKPTTRVDSAGKVEQRSDGSKTTANSTGVSSAPPGYGEARKRFAESATKSKEEKK